MKFSLKSSPKAFTFISPANKKPYQLDYLFIPKDVKVKEIKLVMKTKFLIKSQDYRSFYQ